MYKIQTNKYGESVFVVVRLTDNAFIPFDPANIDYQAYLKWLDAGNTPEAADAAPAQEGNGA
jgi:hypothetical protein